MFSLIKLPPVFNVHQVPKAFQEESIISGYRHPRSSATDCILSLFQLTNETLNVWTHFLPTWYFLYKLLTVVFIHDVWTDAYTWPLLVYLLSCCVYPLASSCAHTFSTMSTRARHICYFFDYGALSLYSLGSAIAYSAYVVPDAWVNSVFHAYYVPVAVTNTVISITMACYSRFAESNRPRFGKVLRILAFSYPYLFDNIPLFYRVYEVLVWVQVKDLQKTIFTVYMTTWKFILSLNVVYSFVSVMMSEPSLTSLDIFLCVGEGCTANEVNRLHVYHILLAFLTGFLFATHLPERLAPGHFDLIGHSHQLFHVCGISGTHFQMQAIERDMALRRSWLHHHAPAMTSRGTLGAIMLSSVISLGIICFFSYPLFYNTAQGKANGKGSRASKKN